MEWPVFRDISRIWESPPGETRWEDNFAALSKCTGYTNISTNQSAHLMVTFWFFQPNPETRIIVWHMRFAQNRAVFQTSPDGNLANWGTSEREYCYYSCPGFISYMTDIWMFRCLSCHRARIWILSQANLVNLSLKLSAYQLQQGIPVIVDNPAQSPATVLVMLLYQCFYAGDVQVFIVANLEGMYVRRYCAKQLGIPHSACMLLTRLTILLKLSHINLIRDSLRATDFNGYDMPKCVIRKICAPSAAQTAETGIVIVWTLRYDLT